MWGSWRESKQSSIIFVEIHHAVNVCLVPLIDVVEFRCLHDQEILISLEADSIIPSTRRELVSVRHGLIVKVIFQDTVLCDDLNPLGQIGGDID